MIKVELITFTPNPEDVVYFAGKTCYSDSNLRLNDLKNIQEDHKLKFIQNIIDSGHLSVLEHVSFTFNLTGVSRVFLAQLTRHRIASYSVRSMRYTTYHFTSDLMFSEVPDINASYKRSIDDYELLVSKGINKEDARYVLPNAAVTSMVVTMNARELLHYFALRCCKRAQYEHRLVANRMLAQVKEVCHLFDNAGSSCVQLGYCPEGKKSCGAYPTLDKLKEAYEKKGE